MRLLGLDPGIRITGWGVIDVEGNRLAHVDDGVIRLDVTATLANRLVQLYGGLSEVIAEFHPEAAAVEEAFVNRNPASTLKLGLARGVVFYIQFYVFSSRMFFLLWIGSDCNLSDNSSRLGID